MLFLIIGNVINAPAIEKREIDFVCIDYFIVSIIFKFFSIGLEIIKFGAFILSSDCTRLYSTDSIRFIFL